MSVVILNIIINIIKYAIKSCLMLKLFNKKKESQILGLIKEKKLNGINLRI